MLVVQNNCKIFFSVHFGDRYLFGAIKKRTVDMHTRKRIHPCNGILFFFLFPLGESEVTKIVHFTKLFSQTTS